MNASAPADRDDRVGAGGITASRIQADNARTHQEAVDAQLHKWFDSELGVYNLEDVRELGRHVV